MIKSQNLVPNIYYKESRDFQLFGRIYDIIFNYAKTNIDLMENFPINNYTDSKLIELLARTLGFNNKLSYRNDDLNAICNVFITLMKNKGSLKSIELLVNTILNVSNINNKAKVTLSDDVQYPLVVISIPDVISNPEVKLLEDVLDYILPIGVCYNIKTTALVDPDKGILIVNDVVQTGNLLNEDKHTYSNIYITANSNDQLDTQNKKQSGDLIKINPENPSTGDIRYSRVIGSQNNLDEGGQ